MNSFVSAARSSLRPALSKRSFTTSRVSRNVNVSDAQKKATEKLSDIQTKGQKLLEDAKDSKAWTQAKAGFEKAGESELWAKTQKALGPIGEKAGNALGAYKEPILYNWAVTREVCKLVYVNELLPPKSLGEIRTAYAHIWSQAGNPTYWKSVFSNGEVARLFIYGLQAYGLFEIGEMVGRLNLVGYSLH